MKFAKLVCALLCTSLWLLPIEVQFHDQTVAVEDQSDLHEQVLALTTLSNATKHKNDDNRCVVSVDGSYLLVQDTNNNIQQYIIPQHGSVADFVSDMYREKKFGK